jgi:hypothetical protein
LRAGWHYRMGDPELPLAPPGVPAPAPVPLLPGAFCSGELPGVVDGVPVGDPGTVFVVEPGVVFNGVALSLVVPCGVADPFEPGAMDRRFLDPG